MRKQEKAFFVDNLAEELKSAKSVILINFSGMGVKAQQELKKRLAKVDARMMVVKNTLFKIAGKAAKIPEETLSDTVLTGQNALIISDNDPLAALQVLGKFALEFEIPQLKVGIIEGHYQDKEDLVKLSKLPGKDALLVQVMAAIGAPIYGLISLLNANTQRLIFVLEQAREKSKSSI